MSIKQTAAQLSAPSQTPLDERAEHPAKASLHGAVDELLQEAGSHYQDRYGHLLQMNILVQQHREQYGHLPGCKEQILDEAARFLVHSGLLQQIHNYPQGTGSFLPVWVPVSSDLPELGRRVIGVLSQQFAEKTATLLPRPHDDSVSHYSKGVLWATRELNAIITPSDTALIDSLTKCLPSLIAAEEWNVVATCFPKTFPGRQSLIDQAQSTYLSRALQELEVPQHYRDWNDRLSQLLDIKDRLQITESASDKESALRILERVWAREDDTQQRLIDGFSINPGEKKQAIINGLCREVADWTYERDFTGGYVQALESVSKIMTVHEISSSDLLFDAARTLPVVLDAESLELVHRYLRTFSLPLSLLADDKFRPQFNKLIEDTLTDRQSGSKEMSAIHRQIIKELCTDGCRDPVLAVLKEVGNRYVKESGGGAIDRLITYIHADPNTFNKSLFIDGAKEVVRLHLSQSNIDEARSVAREFKVDLKSPECQEAAVTGLISIFDSARGSSWNKPLFQEMTKECGLQGVIDNSDLRESVKPIITAELKDGSIPALNGVSAMLKRFGFKEPIAGAELREAAIKGISSAIRDGNGPAIRMLCTQVASDLTTQDIAEVVKDTWRSPEGKQACLENLRYLPDSVKQLLNRDLAFLDYERDLGVAGPITYDRYMKLRNENTRLELQGFIKAVRKEMDSLISSEPQNLETLQQNPRYRELILTIFPNNWGPAASFEATERCLDRSADVRGFRIRKNQGFTLAEGARMRVKTGCEYDGAVALGIDELIDRCALETASSGYSRIGLRTTLLKSLDIESSSAKNDETYQRAVFSVLLNGLSTGSSRPPLDEILVKHRLVEFQDVRNFLRGTRSRVEQAPNTDYANLLELQSFFGDHLRDSINHLVKTAFHENSIIAAAQEYYFTKGQEQSEDQFRDVVNKHCPERLGLSDHFREHFSREFMREMRRLGQISTIPQNLDEIVTSFERAILNPHADEPQLARFPEAFRKKMSGIVSTQRTRTHKFLEAIGYSDLQDLLLAEIDIPQLISRRDTPRATDVDRETLELYFTELLHQQCAPLTEKLSGELRKFEPDTDSPISVTRRKVNCFITKNHTSAHARKTAGVCVSTDNPTQTGENQKNLWDMPHYFQMVLQDDVKKTCLGLVLLHVYEERLAHGTQRILSASYNPSSTFLYQVNERELFAALHRQLEQFAIDNAVDCITVNRSRWVRTNRTGGEFEKAIEGQVAAQGKTLQLSRPQPFCYAYPYQNEDLDVTWERPKIMQRLTTWLKSWLETPQKPTQKPDKR